MIDGLLTLEPSTQAATLIDDLGTTPDDVATALRAEGIRGVRHTGRVLNPLVRYLSTHLGPRVYVDVHQGDLLRMRFPDGGKQKVALSDAAAEFLDAFNRGAYPELELPAGES